jgi:hypothetical protein
MLPNTFVDLLQVPLGAKRGVQGQLAADATWSFGTDEITPDD